MPAGSGYLTEGIEWVDTADVTVISAQQNRIMFRICAFRGGCGTK